MIPRFARDKLDSTAFFVLVVIAAIVPLRSYDLFWHLATGHWIREQHALPLSDPFALASDRTPWVNGEWLFDVVIEPLQRMVGFAGLSILRSLFAGALFTAVYFLARRKLDEPQAGVATAIAFAGANPLLDVRPASLAPAFLVAAMALARRSLIGFLIVTIFWINVHPSALLAPIVMLVMTRSLPRTAAAAAALFVNPFGWRAITAPLALNAFATSGAFTNAEWRWSSPLVFPLLYIAIVTGVCLFLFLKDRQLWQMMLFAGLAVLAVLHVRHQPLFFAAFPLLLPRFGVARWPAHAITCSMLVLAIVVAPHHIGLSPHRWPISAVERLKASGLRGNIYNPDQFGGFLIWSFYPERRTLTDGRNELYRTFIAEYARARNDQRAWDALLSRYRIDLAVDEYRSGRVPVMNTVTKRIALTPSSLVYWPRDRWALIGYDDVGMVFARRSAFAPEVLQRWEIRGVLPDAR